MRRRGRRAPRRRFRRVQRRGGGGNTPTFTKDFAFQIPASSTSGALVINWGQILSENSTMGSYAMRAMKLVFAAAVVTSRYDNPGTNMQLEYMGFPSDKAGFALSRQALCSPTGTVNMVVRPRRSHDFHVPAADSNFLRITADNMGSTSTVAQVYAAKVTCKFALGRAANLENQVLSTRDHLDTYIRDILSGDNDKIDTPRLTQIQRPRSAIGMLSSTR